MAEVTQDQINSFKNNSKSPELKRPNPPTAQATPPQPSDTDRATEGLVQTRRELVKVNRAERSRQKAAVVQQGIKDAIEDQTLYEAARTRTLQMLYSSEVEAVVLEDVDNGVPQLAANEQVDAAIAGFFGNTPIGGVLQKALPDLLSSTSKPQ